MAVIDSPGLPNEIHIGIKYQMATCFLISYRNMIPILQYFKGYTDLVNLFFIGILPKSVSILFVKIYGFFNIVGNMDSKLMVSFPNLAIHRRSDVISLLRSIPPPTTKSPVHLPSQEVLHTPPPQ